LSFPRKRRPCRYHRRDGELAELDAVIAGARRFADLPPRVGAAGNERAIVCVNPEFMLSFSTRRIELRVQAAASERGEFETALHNLKREWRGKKIFYLDSL
jgi:hypothetical protein